MLLRCSLIFTVETWLLGGPSWYGIHTAVTGWQFCFVSFKTLHLPPYLSNGISVAVKVGYASKSILRENGNYLCTDFECRSFFRNKNIWNSQTRKGCVWTEKSVKLGVLSVHLTKSRIFCKTVEQSYVEMHANPFYYTLWHRTLSSGDKNMVTIHH